MVSLSSVILRTAVKGNFKREMRGKAKRRGKESRKRGKGGRKGRREEAGSARVKSAARLGTARSVDDSVETRADSAAVFGVNLCSNSHRLYN